MTDYFAVLGLKRTASDSEIREAYRRMAKLYHPDSNPSQSDPDSARRMQEINQAKAILFDTVKREEHRVMLGLREKLTAERLSQLREEFRYQRANYPVTPNIPKETVHFSAPKGKWDVLSGKGLIVVVIACMLAISGLVGYVVTRPSEVNADPIKALIERYHNRERLPFGDGMAADVDTLRVDDDSLPRLKRHGDILLGLGEYRSASKYYERFLQHDTSDEVIKNLSFAYFKRGRYAQSLEVLSKQMRGDSNLVVAYYNIGELFLHEEKPLDARNAFEAAVKLANEMASRGRTPPQFTLKARAELARLD